MKEQSFKELFTECKSLDEFFLDNWEYTVKHKGIQKVIDVIDQNFDIEGVKEIKKGSYTMVKVKILGSPSSSQLERLEDEFEEFLFSYSHRNNVLSIEDI